MAVAPVSAECTVSLPTALPAVVRSAGNHCLVFIGILKHKLEDPGPFTTGKTTQDIVYERTRGTLRGARHLTLQKRMDTGINNCIRATKIEVGAGGSTSVLFIILIETTFFS